MIQAVDSAASGDDFGLSPASVCKVCSSAREGLLTIAPRVAEDLKGMADERKGANLELGVICEHDGHPNLSLETRQARANRPTGYRRISRTFKLCALFSYAAFDL